MARVWNVDLRKKVVEAGRAIGVTASVLGVFLVILGVTALLRPGVPEGCPEGEVGPLVDLAPYLYLDTGVYLGVARTVEDAAVGPEIAQTRCSYQDGLRPDGEPQVGDSAFLPAGTPLHLVQGSGVTQQVVAVTEDGYQLFIRIPNQ